MGRAPLGPEEVQCPSVGECQGGKIRVGEWVSGWGSILIESGRGDELGVVWRGDLERG